VSTVFGWLPDPAGPEDVARLELVVTAQSPDASHHATLVSDVR
jgi:hypothetical protein